MSCKIAYFCVAFVLSCGGSPSSSSPNSPATAAQASPTATVAVANDPLGPKPEVSTPNPFKPATPELHQLKNGTWVWLLERHALPVVAITVAIPFGASSDSVGKAGLAFATATMLDEGAGKLDALGISRATDKLGATLHTGASADFSYVSLTTLKRNLAPAVALLADVVVHPTFPAIEWRRVHELWQNDLRARASEPDAVAAVVSLAALYGPDHPYGHPTEGTLASAGNVALEDVVRFYGDYWRPQLATIVIVGDITPAELDATLAPALKDWKTEAPEKSDRAGARLAAGGGIVTPPAPTGPWPRLVLVDRPDAPQSVIAVVRPGIAASEYDAPLLGRVNIALGGSFTSRLNQDLREEHGWSYGARSRITFTRGPGSIVASAAVHTEKTADALKALLADVDAYARGGLTDEEVGKTRLQARSDLIDILETGDGAALRLARDAALGLGPEYEGQASARRDSAPKADLDKVAGRFFDTKQAIVIIVGPRAKLLGPLAALGFTTPELRDPEGHILKPEAAAKSNVREKNEKGK